MRIRFAQEYGGQKLHIVEDFGNGEVGFRALCGRMPVKRGSWRLTFNFPMGYCCGNCRRVLESYKRAEAAPEENAQSDLEYARRVVSSMHALQKEIDGILEAQQ